MSKVGIIGGSGVYSLDDFRLISETIVETPFGQPSSKIKSISIGDSEFYFLPRHGEGHRLNPSEINYRANIYGMKKLGVENIISVSAVGSLKEEFEPGHFVVPSQFIDWTKGLRSRTFFDSGMVGHVSVANPVSESLRQRIINFKNDIGTTMHTDANYICIEGPQFSTHFESRYYKNMGAGIIGMTNVPEAYLAKEAGIEYATIGMVTDYDAWKDDHCTLEEIMKVMNQNYKSAQKLLSLLIPSLVKEPIVRNQENQNAIVTNPKLISESQKSIIDILLK